MDDPQLFSFLDRVGDAICPNPIFVIGSPRSGTTGLPRALATHSRLWTSHESYILNQLYGNGRAGEVWRSNAEREQAPSWIKTEGVSRAEFLGFLGVGVNALYTSRSGGRRWIDQTPLNTLMVDDLGDMFPGAQFVHMLRDGRRVVNSMINFLSKFQGRPQARKYVPQWATDFTQACRTWRRWTETANDFCTRKPERGTTLVNERLTADPEAGFAELYRFLGVQWEDGPVEAYMGERVNSSFARTPGGPSAATALPEWTSEQRATFFDEAGELMIRLGLAEPDELKAWMVGSDDGP